MHNERLVPTPRKREKGILFRNTLIRIGVICVVVFIAYKVYEWLTPDAYFEETLTRSRRGVAYNDLFLTPNHRTFFYRYSSKVYLYNLETYEVQEVDMDTMDPVCRVLRPLTDWVLVCLTDTRPVLYRYPGMQRIHALLSLAEIDSAQPMTFFLLSGSNPEGFVMQNDHWWVVNPDTMVGLEPEEIIVLSEDGNPPQNTPIFSPDLSHYFVLDKDTLSVYSSQDEELRWQKRTAITFEVAGWRYDGCGLIYSYQPTWELYDTGVPIYAYNVPCNPAIVTSKNPS